MASAELSVILVTLNAARTIGDQLAAIREQNCIVRDIVVIDSSSDDQTAVIAAAGGAKVLTIDRASFNHGATRNLGAAAAEGTLLVFMTQDAMPADRDTLKNLISPILRGDAVAAYARQIAPKNADPIEKFWRQHNYQALSLLKNKQRTTDRPYFFSNVCSVLRRDVFIEQGGFPALAFGEDMMMAYRLIQGGYTVAYESSAIVLHSHRFTLGQKLNRYYQVGLFNQANRFLTDHRSNEREGLATALALLRQLAANGQYRHMPVGLADMGLRYLAYALGRLSVMRNGGFRAGGEPL